MKEKNDIPTSIQLKVDASFTGKSIYFLGGGGYVNIKREKKFIVKKWLKDAKKKKKIEIKNKNKNKNKKQKQKTKTKTKSKKQKQKQQQKQKQKTKTKTKETNSKIKKYIKQIEKKCICPWSFQWEN